MKTSIQQRKYVWPFLLFIFLCILFSCTSMSSPTAGSSSARPGQFAPSPRSAEDLLIVDCLLPGQVRKLGKMIYHTARRPTQTTAMDCEIRGGEYVAYDRSNYATALSVWLTKAEDGDMVAQNHVGEIYVKGIGSTPQYEFAVPWFQKSADQGYKRAKLNLGYLYEQGLGISRDPLKALNLYREATGLSETIMVDQEQTDLVGKQRREIDDLRQKAKIRNVEVEALQRQLEEVQTELERMRQEYELRKGAIETGDERVALLKAQIEGSSMEAQLKDQRVETSRLKEKSTESERQKGPTDEINLSNKRIKQLEAELIRRNRELAAERAEAKGLDQQIARLDALAKEYRNQLSQKQKKREKPDGPTIEIINPRVVETRGVRIVSVSQGARQQLIIGNVKGLAGIYSFMVNQKEVELDPQGLFRASIPLKRSEDTPVEIVAVDKKGKRTDYNFSIPSEASELQTLPAKPKLASLNFGRYHALLIGNNDYQKYDRLSSAVNDAQSISKILAGKYNFSTKVLINANRYEILKALDDFRRNLKENDNFLLYYAGHGELDKKNKRGYWLPVDAEPNSHVNDVPNFAVTDILNNMEVKQAIIVADTCYSGILTRSAVNREISELTEEKRYNWLEKLVENRSRTVLSSGGLKPVLDSGIGNHSVFARALIDTLESNQDVLEANRLHTKIGALVAYTSSEMGYEQVPQYAANLHAGHIGGDFLFVPTRFQ